MWPEPAFTYNIALSRPNYTTTFVACTYIQSYRSVNRRTRSSSKIYYSNLYHSFSGRSCKVSRNSYIYTRIQVPSTMDPWYRVPATGTAYRGTAVGGSGTAVLAHYVQYSQYSGLTGRNLQLYSCTLYRQLGLLYMCVCVAFGSEQRPVAGSGSRSQGALAGYSTAGLSLLEPKLPMRLS